MLDPLIRLSSTSRIFMFLLLFGKDRFFLQSPFLPQSFDFRFEFGLNVSTLNPLGTRAASLPRAHFITSPMESHRRTDQARGQSRFRILPQNRSNELKQFANLCTRRAMEKRNQHVSSSFRRNDDNLRRSSFSSGT